ncbi:hypothetical protein MKQ70_20765 [Chitinophaga sedimenti]|uniref:hypothetical protein n=1 Tax=Chitinophaga sedimenti TaxID=2033606 RepID=UPI002005010F|nr:hypothetical protein [Chitinophaga sedimenti]MCK7557303.1 hypothetical protein [Chitinophaga sedimenti]
MKKMIYFAMMLLGLAFVKPANAQVRININIGSQPLWGPAGYDYAGYYYFPDIEAYYDVPARQYIYRDGRNWVRKNSLPGRYANFDLYKHYKVVINDRNPRMRHDAYRNKYISYRGRTKQDLIRDHRNDRRDYADNHRNNRNDRFDRNDRNDRHDRNDRNDRGINRGRF